MASHTMIMAKLARIAGINWINLSLISRKV
jgi:hypothetical protein